MAEIPSTIEIGPLRYSVRIDQKAIDLERKESRDTGCLGYIRRHSQEIVLAEDQGPDQLRISLLHEVIHGIVGVASVYDIKADDEAAVTAISTYLLDTVRRNPDLVKYLVEE